MAEAARAAGQGKRWWRGSRREQCVYVERYNCRRRRWRGCRRRVYLMDARCGSESVSTRYHASTRTNAPRFIHPHPHPQVNFTQALYARTLVCRQQARWASYKARRKTKRRGRSELQDGGVELEARGNEEPPAARAARSRTRTCGAGRRHTRAAGLHIRRASVYEDLNRHPRMRIT